MGTWSFVLIPDTQYLVESEVGPGHPEYFGAMRDWIIKNKEPRNIKMVGHLGDIVDRGAAVPGAWQEAKNALFPLMDLGIPVMLTSGNHDGDSVGSFLSSPFTTYNQHFGPHIYAGKSWFGGVKTAGDARNAYALFSGGDYDYLVIQMEQYAGGSVMRWIGDLSRAYPNRRIIILSHEFLRRTGERMVWEYGARNPVDRWLGADEMWDAYGLKRIPNLWAIFNGHFSGYTAQRIDLNDFGHKVLQGFFNFQWYYSDAGGAGRIVVMTVNDDNNTITQEVILPYNDMVDNSVDTVFNFCTTHDLNVTQTAPKLNPRGMAVRVGSSLYSIGN